MGPDYNPPDAKTHFHYPADRGSFARATLRCVGVGKCRREEGGVMCPSYMVTREEQHSTRGRAHLLWEMLNGEVIEDGWKSESVKEALDLCLACKGCKNDCPVNVDMATYKAEFLSHYYEGRLRPRHAYAFGYIHEWCKVAERIPVAANLATRLPGLGPLAKRLAGMATARTAPMFAVETFRHWMARRRPRTRRGPPVVLFPDTFNNHFHPETARAAVRVLESAGFSVRLPATDLCCGRPLYDYGLLDRARWRLRQVLDTLRRELNAGIPVVVLEPSCAAVFRDELPNLIPNDEDAHRLRRQTLLLSEFLQQRAPEYRPPRLERRALVHGHCHQRSVLDFDAEKAVLDQMGLEYDMPGDGCCGMAGAFGFEDGRQYEVSVAAGERQLLPAVRRAGRHTLIIADGFSCREQIAQGSDRHALHLADVLWMAHRHGPKGPRNGSAETTLVRERNDALVAAGLRSVLMLGAGIATGALALGIARSRRG